MRVFICIRALLDTVDGRCVYALLSTVDGTTCGGEGYVGMCVMMCVV